MRHVIIAAALALASFAAAARDTVIYSGRLANALNAATNRITNLAYPTDASDAVTKSYVDAAGGMTPQNVGTIATNTVTAKVEAWAMKPHVEPATTTVVTNIVDDFFGLPTETSRTPEYTYVALDEGFTITNFSVDETEEDRVRYQFIWAEGEHLGYNTGATTYRTRPVTPFSQDFTVVDEGGQADPLRVRLTYSMNRYGVARLADAVGIATNAALAVVGPVTSALTSVSNAAVSASALASAAMPRAEVTNAVDALVAVTNGANRYNLQTRLTSANAGANIAITPYAYKWNVYGYPKYAAVYSHGIPTSYYEASGTYPAYEDEACTVRATIDEAPSVKDASMVFESDYGRYCLLSDDLIEEYRASNDTTYVQTAVYISAPNAQITGNIVTNISASSDDVHYPSAKAAYDCATNAASVATSDMETKTHAENTYQVKGDYATKAEAGASAANVVAGVTNNIAVAIGRSAVAVHKRISSDYPVAIGYDAKSTNKYSTAIGYMAHSHGNHTVNFQEVTNNVSAVGSLSQIYFGDFTLRQMVTNDTQLWQDCASPVASNVLETVTTFGASPATGSVIQRLNAVESTVGTANAALQRILEGN